MSRGSSNKLLSIVNAETPNDIFLHLVTVEWPDNTVNRFVKNAEPVNSRGETYQASSFEIQLPEEPEDTVPTLTFQFSVSDTQIIQKLRQSDGNALPILTLEVVLASDPNIVEMGPFTFEIRKYQNQGVAVAVEAGFEPILDFALPQLAYNPSVTPGLFKNVTSADFQP